MPACINYFFLIENKYLENSSFQKYRLPNRLPAVNQSFDEKKVLEQIHGHTIDEAVLEGRYQKGKQV